MQWQQQNISKETANIHSQLEVMNSTSLYINILHQQVEEFKSATETSLQQQHQNMSEAITKMCIQLKARGQKCEEFKSANEGKQHMAGDIEEKMHKVINTAAGQQQIVAFKKNPKRSVL